MFLKVEKHDNDSDYRPSEEECKEIVEDVDNAKKECDELPNETDEE